MAIQSLFVPLALVLLLNICYFEGIAGYGEYYVTVKDECQGYSFAGTILAHNLILVAASSVANSSLYNPTSLLVSAGVTSDNPKQTVQIRRSSRVYISFPELYNQYNHEFDFAKIIVDPPFTLNDYVKTLPFTCNFNPAPTGDTTSIVRDKTIPDKYAEEVKIIQAPDAACLALYGGTNKTASCGVELDGFSNAFKKSDIGTPNVVGGFLVAIIINVPDKNDPNPKKNPIMGTDFSKVCPMLSAAQIQRVIGY